MHSVLRLSLRVCGSCVPWGGGFPAPRTGNHTPFVQIGKVFFLPPPSWPQDRAGRNDSSRAPPPESSGFAVRQPFNLFSCLSELRNSSCCRALAQEIRRHRGNASSMPLAVLSGRSPLSALTEWEATPRARSECRWQRPVSPRPFRSGRAGHRFHHRFRRCLPPAPR